MATASELDILTRLAANMLEIGVQRSWATSPAHPIADMDLPASYGVAGPTTQPSSESAGRLAVVRTFILRLHIMTASQGMDDDTLGAELNTRALPFLNDVHVYFASHPRLHTATLPMLGGVQGVLSLRDSGIVMQKGPGGGDYGSVNFLLEIQYKKNIPASAVPYNA